MPDKEHTFDIFGELSIQTNGNHDAVFERIESTLKEPWSVPIVDDQTPGFWYFDYRPDTGPPRRVCFALRRDEGICYVSNVLPLEGRQLPMEHYNGGIERFHKDVLELLGVDAEMQTEAVTLSKWLSLETREALEQFAGLANIADCGTHPRDRERLYDTIILAYENGDDMPRKEFMEWMQAQSFSRECADDLRSIWVEGLALLKRYGHCSPSGARGCHE